MIRLFSRLFRRTSSHKATDPNLERILGHHFADEELLHRALTHRSIFHNQGGNHQQANEILEFLGDAVLGLVVVEYLYRRFPQKNEGDLSKLKGTLVSGKTLEELARQLGIGRFIVMSESEARNGGRRRGSILEDAFEALVGALYLDGGRQVAENFIRRHLLPQVDILVREGRDDNHKSRLLEYAQAHGLPSPEYLVISETGPDHSKEFGIEVRMNGEKYGQGYGKSKKIAQQQAARIAYELIVKRQPGNRGGSPNEFYRTGG